MNAGLFEPGEPYPGIYNRLGDFIVEAKGNADWCGLQRIIHSLTVMVDYQKTDAGSFPGGTVLMG